MRVQPIKVAAVVILLLTTLLLFQKDKVSELRNSIFSVNANTNDLSQKKSTALFESQIIPQPKYLSAAHSSSFTILPNGDLLAFWFAGTREGNPDVKIWQSTYHNNQWSMATPLVDPQMVSEANHRYVVKVGNPVIYRAANSDLHLFVVSVSVGGWSGSTLNHLISHDNGKTWSKPERIVSSPFFNISTLVRTSAISLSDGGFYLPVYHEFIRKYPELLRFDANGNFIEQIRITSKNHMLQPSLMPVGADTAFAYFRNSTTKKNESRNVFVSKTIDGGKTWTEPVAINLTNPDSSIIAINLNDGRFLMIYNQDDRGHLWLAISNDGINWHPIYQLENTLNDEFSYPDIQINGDIIDVIYTNNRKNIKHVRFNRTWLNEVAANAK